MHVLVNKTQRPRKLRTAILTIIIVGALVSLKSVALWLSSSVSILSSLIDSVLDSLVSIMALGSILYSQRPADEDHRWGHGKIEGVSALIQASIILGGSVFLIFTSVGRILQPQTIDDHWLAIAVMCVSIVLSMALVAMQRAALRTTDSLAIEAEQLHYGSDVLINIGTVLVLIASLQGAPVVIDALFAIGAAAYMANLARTIIMKSLNMLLDRELPDEDRDLIIKHIERHGAVLGWHDLRTRRHGDFYDISFDIEVDASLSLWDAHEVTKDLERELVQLYPICDVMIHVDPQGFIDDERHRVKGIHI